MWAFLVPVIILLGLVLLFGVFVFLGRFRGGRYLRPIVAQLSRIKFFRRMFMRLSTAALERQNPELASAMKKMEIYGQPKTPQQAQALINRLSPSERKAYMAAATEQGAMPEPANRQQRRQMERMAPAAAPVAAGRKSGKKKKRR